MSSQETDLALCCCTLSPWPVGHIGAARVAFLQQSIPHIKFGEYHSSDISFPETMQRIFYH